MPPVPAATFDSLVLAAVAEEIRQRLPLRVVRVDPGGPHEVVVRTDAGALLFSAHPQWARVHFTRRRPEHKTPHPFADLLRARLVGGRVQGVEQPAFERVLVLEVEAADGLWELVAEPMGKHANLLLVREGRVVGVARPVPQDRSRVRPLLAGLPYRPPPPDPRPKPGEVEEGALEVCLRETHEPLWRAVLRCVAGVGPLAAYELASRCGDPEGCCARPSGVRELFAALEELRHRVRAGAFDPHAYGPPDRPVSFTPFPYVCLRELASTRLEMSEAVDRVLGARAATERLQARRAALVARVEALASRKKSTLRQVQEDLAKAQEGYRLREWGQLLLAHAHRVPPGSSSVRLVGWDGSPVEIPLDPSRDAVQNAQELFRRYAKLRAALQTLPARVQALEEELFALQTLRVHAETARTHEELDEVEADLPPTKAGAPRPRPTRTARVWWVDGFQVLVGRSNRDNERVTFQLASPADLWFHARGLPGAHVVLRTGGRRPPEETLRRVASLAAYHSAGRHAAAVDVDYTERRSVRRLPGPFPGRVTYRNERTLRVSPAPPEQLGASREPSGPGTAPDPP